MRSIVRTALWALLVLPSLAHAQGTADEMFLDAPITKLPSVKTFVDAVYPKAALRDRVSASVVLEIDITTKGTVENIAVVQSSTVATATSSTGVAASPTTTSTSTEPVADYGFTASATTAASQLVFNPAESNGTPVPVRIAYTFNFEPPPPPPPPAVTTSTTAAPVEKPGIANFIGTVRERGTRDPLSGAIVTVFQQRDEDVVAFEATTDKEGRFEFFDLDPGIWKVQGDLAAYYPLRDAEKIAPNEIAEVTYYMEKGDYNPYEVIVVGKRVIKEVNRRTLTRDEIVKVPGTLGDPITVVENLPGVARTQGGQIVVRGSGPQDTGVFIDGIEVPLIYHFGGLKSVIPAEVVDSVDFYPGNYSTYYGRYTGGIFDAHIRTVDAEQIHGSLDVSVLDTSLYLEVPIGDSFTFAIGGRRSYIDLLINAAVPDDGDFSIVSAPVYYDYQVLANWRPAAAHEVRAFFLGSDDTFALLFENPGDLDSQIQATSFNLGTSFQRGVIEYRYTPSTSYKHSFKAAVGVDKANFNLGEQFFFNLKTIGIQGRDNTEWQATDWLNINVGADLLFQIADVSVLAPGTGPREGEVGGTDDFTDTTFSAVDNAFFGTISPYVEAKIDLMDDRLSLVPGLRMDWWSAVGGAVSFDPRITARYAIDKEWAVKGGVALTHQSPLPQDLDENFGNPDLGLQEATQYSVGGEWTPADYLKLDLTFFLKDLNSLVASTTAVRDDGSQLRVDNTGSGTVIGLEVFAEHKFNNNFRGWLSYTLSRAVRKDAPDGDTRLFDFDQTHILTLVASYVLPENWEVGLRWRLVSGNPYTPFTGSIFLDGADRPTPIPGDTNSQRLAAFHQLDLRIDKTWVFDYWKFSAYLSLLNTYNKKNTEGLSYEFDYSRSEPVQGLPILPILGVKGDF